MHCTAHDAENASVVPTHPLPPAALSKCNGPKSGKAMERRFEKERKSWQYGLHGDGVSVLYMMRDCIGACARAWKSRLHSAESKLGLDDGPVILRDHDRE